MSGPADLCEKCVPIFLKINRDCAEITGHWREVAERERALADRLAEALQEPADGDEWTEEWQVKAEAALAAYAEARR